MRIKRGRAGGGDAWLALVEQQVWNAFKMPDIAGNNSQVMVECRCRNEDICLANHAAGLPELAPDAGKPLHNRLIERQHIGLA